MSDTRHDKNEFEELKALPTVVWGTYDKGKPRVRILLKGLSEAGYRLVEQNISLWEGIEDKSQVRGFYSFAKIALILFIAYPNLVWRYWFAPKHHFVLLPYLSHLDVLVIWPFAKLRGAKIVWDVFVPLYSGVVEDRKLVAKKSWKARLIYGFEWLATRASDAPFLDTIAHAEQFTRLYCLPEWSVGSVMVGVEPDYFRPMSAPEPIEGESNERQINVLFYGQFIPLHGVDTIFEAARRSQGSRIRWTIIGQGQLASKWQKELAKSPIENLIWIDWVDYEALIAHIERADVCLGIFGGTEKADVVVPNKVYQMLASARPVITRRSSAIEELAADPDLNLMLVDAEDPQGLIEAIQSFAIETDPWKCAQHAGAYHRHAANKFGPLAVSEQYSRMLGDFVARSREGL